MRQEYAPPLPPKKVPKKPQERETKKSTHLFLYDYNNSTLNENQIKRFYNLFTIYSSIEFKFEGYI